MITVHLIDDHAMVRAGFRRLLEAEGDIKIVGESGCGETAYPECLKQKPDVVVVDISMPGEGGLAFMRRILTKDSEMKLLVMSMHDNETFFAHALQLGAKGYLTKSGNTDELVEAVRSIAAGGRWISPEFTQKVANNFGGKYESPVNVLTTREFEIFLLLSDGKNAHDIGKTLHISPKTVNVHRANLMEKLKVKNTVELAHIAMRLDMIQA